MNEEFHPHYEGGFGIKIMHTQCVVIIHHCHMQLKPFFKAFGRLLQVFTRDHSTLDVQSQSTGVTYVITQAHFNLYTQEESLNSGML